LQHNVNGVTQANAHIGALIGTSLNSRKHTINRTCRDYCQVACDAEIKTKAPHTLRHHQTQISYINVRSATLTNYLEKAVGMTPVSSKNGLGTAGHLHLLLHLQSDTDAECTKPVDRQRQAWAATRGHTDTDSWSSWCR